MSHTNEGKWMCTVETLYESNIILFFRTWATKTVVWAQFGCREWKNHTKNVFSRIFCVLIIFTVDYDDDDDDYEIIFAAKMWMRQRTSHISSNLPKQREKKRIIQNEREGKNEKNERKKWEKWLKKILWKMLTLD